MHFVYLALGANIGDRHLYLSQAYKALEKIGQISKKSKIYETKAWGKEDQANFLNQVLLLKTDLTPEKLLKNCQKIENNLGRIRTEKWGPRTIDIDILFYDNLVLNKPNLSIPHPYLAERKFVLEPLHEIAPKLVHPVLNLTVEELLHRIKDDNYVKVC